MFRYSKVFFSIYILLCYILWRHPLIILFLTVVQIWDQSCWSSPVVQNDTLLRLCAPSLCSPFYSICEKCGFTSCTLLKGFFVPWVYVVGLESRHRLQHVDFWKLDKCSLTEIPNLTVQRSFSVVLTELYLKLAAVFGLSASLRSFTGLPHFSATFTDRGLVNDIFF